MTKYTRSIEKLSMAIKDIFEAKGISTDTKAIVLVLAATMSPRKFKALIEPIEDLGCTRVKLIEINALRAIFGSVFRDYIVLHALKITKRKITGNELQRYIRYAGHKSKKDQAKELDQALNMSELNPETAWESKTDQQSFGLIMQKAADFLIYKLSLSRQTQAHSIIETYLHCRSKVDPVVAYCAVIHAMADILKASGLDAKEALGNSYKLTKHALGLFIKDSDHPNSMLHTYKSLISS